MHYPGTRERRVPNVQSLNLVPNLHIPHAFKHDVKLVLPFVCMRSMLLPRLGQSISMLL